MSDNIIPLSCFRILDPRLNLNQPRSAAILRGGKFITEQTFPSNNFSTTSISFDCRPPSQKQVIDRRALMKFYVQFDFTGTVSGGATQLLNIGSTDALAFLPMQSNCTNVQATINNNNFNLASAELLPALFRCGAMKDEKGFDLSTLPSMQDGVQNYNEAFGFVANALAGELDSTSDQQGRGSSVFYDVISNTSTTASVQTSFTEPLVLSPYLWGKCKDYHAGFFGVTQMQVLLTLKNPLDSMWSHDAVSANSTLTSVTVSLYAQPTISFRYLTPDELFYSEILKAQVYPYYDIQRFADPPVLLTPGETVQVFSQNLNIKSVPEKIFIFAQEFLGDRSVNNVQGVFAGLSNLAITWNGASNLLSSATPEQLWETSRANGLSYSWNDWNRIGAMIILCPAKDLQTGSFLDAPLMSGNYNLQINAQMQNLNSQRDVNMQFYVVTVSTGTATIAGNKVQTNEGIISKEDVLNASQVAGLDYHTVEASGSGNFFDTFKQIARSAVSAIPNAVSTAIKYGPQAVDLYNKYGPDVRKAIGLGTMDGRRRRRMPVRRRKHRAGMFVGDGDLIMGSGYGGEDSGEGAGYTGGKMISRSELKKRAEEGMGTDDEGEGQSVEEYSGSDDE